MKDVRVHAPPSMLDGFPDDDQADQLESPFCNAGEMLVHLAQREGPPDISYARMVEEGSRVLGVRGEASGKLRAARQGDAPQLEDATRLAAGEVRPVRRDAVRHGFSCLVSRYA